MDDLTPQLLPDDQGDDLGFGPITPIGAPEPKIILYPLDQLPPRIRNTILAVQTVADCHPNTAAWAVMGSASAAAQCVATVETLAGKGREVPVSLYTHLVAPSGSRKSTAFSAAWHGLGVADARLQKAHIERRARAAANPKAKSGDGDNDQNAHRIGGTIKQVVTEPTMEAMVRDMDIGFPYPVLASAEGAAFYYGYSSAGNSGRAMQTASILATGFSGEAININRIGSDGKAPNRSIDAGAYALGVHYAVQDISMGHAMLFGADSEYGLGARTLAYWTPPRATLAPTRYDDEALDTANLQIGAWGKHLESIRSHVDNAILTSERGGTARSRITLPSAIRSIIHDVLADFADMADTPGDIAIYDRIAEQVIRIAATIQIAEQGISAIGEVIPLLPDFIAAAAAIARFHWETRRAIFGSAEATHLEEACVSICLNAFRWARDGAGSKGKRGYDPDSITWGWSAVLSISQHTGGRGKYARDSEFKLRCRNHLKDTEHMREVGARVRFNPAFLEAYEGQID